MANRDKMKLEDVQEKLIEAELAGDGSELDNLIDEDYQGIDPNGLDLSKTMVITHYTANKFSLEELRVADFKIRIIEDVGLITGRTIMRGQIESELFGR